jgi:predicted methyltransferase MtxX (methanogen marker protein 4)
MRLRSVANLCHASSKAKEQWTAQHREFVVEAYFKNGDLLLKHDYFAHILIFRVMAVLLVVTP